MPILLPWLSARVIVAVTRVELVVSSCRSVFTSSRGLCEEATPDRVAIRLAVLLVAGQAGKCDVIREIKLNGSPGVVTNMVQPESDTST